MPIYVILEKFTEQGHKAIKETVRRARESRRENEARGFKVVGTYWTQGRYDIVTVVDAPSEDAMMAGLFNIAEAGNVHSEALRGFTEQEIERILALTG